jgi:hypothetical protein
MAIVLGLLGAGLVFLGIGVWWHLRCGIARGYDLFADFAPVIGNPRAPRAILRFVIYLILAVLDSQSFIPAMARYAVRH